MNNNRVIVVSIVEVIIIITLLIVVIISIFGGLDTQILALIVAVISLAITIMERIARRLENERATQVKRITARQYDKNLFKDIESEINKLKETGNIIDSVHLIDASDYNDHRKEAMILYH